MKLIEIVNAKAALQKLAAQDLPLKEAYGLVQTVESCNTFLKFYGQEIVKINPEKEPERLKELNEMEAEDYTPTPIRVCLDTDGVKLSASDVKALGAFVEFYVKQE